MALKILDSRQLRGRLCEQAAERHVQAQGLTVIGRNLRCRAGELDLVCLEGRVLVVIEVRQRTTRDYGGALASIGAAKRRRIIRATGYFALRERGWRGLPIRFDVIAIDGAVALDGPVALDEPVAPDGAHPSMIWIKDAFRTG